MFGNLDRKNIFDSNSTEYIGNDYFPLKVGLTWIYQLSGSHKSINTITIVGKKQIEVLAFFQNGTQAAYLT